MEERFDNVSLMTLFLVKKKTVSFMKEKPLKHQEYWRDIGHFKISF